MKDSEKVPATGFVLHRVYFVEQTLRLVELSDEQPQTESPIAFGWDWRITGTRAFDVILQLRLGPARVRPEEAALTVCGSFGVDGSSPSVDTAEFVRAQGPAILFPYLREALASLTGRSAHGAHHLAPVNVLMLMQNFDPDKATGAQQLKGGGEALFLAAQ